MSQSNVHLHALLNFSEKVMKLSFFFSHKTMLSQSRPQWVHQDRVSGDDASRVWARGSAHLNHIYTDGQLTHFSGSCTRLHVKRFRWKGQMKLQLLLSIWHKELRCQKDDPPRCFIWYSRHFGARPFRGWSGRLRFLLFKEEAILQPTMRCAACHVWRFNAPLSFNTSQHVYMQTGGERVTVHRTLRASSPSSKHMQF